MPVFRASPHRRRRWILGGAVTVAAAAVVLGLMFTRHSPAPSPAGIIRLIITPPPDVTLNPSAAALAVSPDGRTLAFVAASPDGRSGLWVRPFDSIAARRIPGTDGAVQPFWSPDSRYLAFISEDGKLKRVDVASGVTETIAEGFGQGGAWNHDGVILWKLLQSSSLMRVSASGGPVTAATVLNAARGETAHASPQFLPDGRHFLYLARSRQPAHDGVLCVASLDAPVGVELLKTESAAAYAPPGFLLYVKGNTLLAHPFDAATLRLSGDPMPVAEQVENNTTTHRATFSVSQTGVLAYRSLGGMQLMWMDRSGRSLDAVGPPGIYSNPALSADERMLAVARNDAATNAPHVWTLELARGVMSRLTSGSSGELMPVWSRDGRRIAYKSGNSFYQMASSGTGDPELLLSDAGAFAAPLGWSRDGRAMLYEASTERTRLDLMLLPLDARTPRVLLRTPFDETQAQPSPDGRWLAHVSNESGSNEVYVRSFDSGDGKWRISTASGTEPQWRRDGRELFYLAADRRLMAVPVGSRSTFDLGSPSPLFETRMSTFRNPAFTRNQYVVAGSEPRFLVSQPSKETSSSPVTVIVHWTEGLKP